MDGVVRWLLPAFAAAGIVAFAAVVWLTATTPAFQPVDRPLTRLAVVNLDGSPLPGLAQEPRAVLLVWMPG